jgi:hypothetical protein
VRFKIKELNLEAKESKKEGAVLDGNQIYGEFIQVTVFNDRNSLRKKV